MPASMQWHWAVLAFAIPLLAQLQPGFRVDVDLVRVPCVVTDKRGATVTDLRREDFIIREDGIPREVKYLWREADLPLTIGLVADVSGSQYRLIQQHRQIVLQFLSQILSPNDRAFLVSVEKQQRLVTDLTNSSESLSAGVEDLGRLDAGILGDPCKGVRRRFLLTTILMPCGGTTLWNGVFFAARLKLRPQSGRKAMLLLTDGWDTGSEHSLVDAIEASQGADAMVYSIRYDDPALRSVAARQLAKGKRDLDRITRETGGLAFEGQPNNARQIFDSIETALRSQYVLAYTPNASKHRKGHHRTEVTLMRPGLTVRARAGYDEP